MFVTATAFASDYAQPYENGNNTTLLASNQSKKSTSKKTKNTKNTKTSTKKDTSWIQGNWKATSPYGEARVGISGSTISVWFNGSESYTGPFSIEGDNIVYGRGPGYACVLPINWTKKCLMFDDNTPYQRFSSTSKTNSNTNNSSWIIGKWGGLFPHTSLRVTITNSSIKVTKNGLKIYEGPYSINGDEIIYKTKSNSYRPTIKINWQKKCLFLLEDNTMITKIEEK